MNEKIEPLLLPHEQERIQDELGGIEKMLNAPPHVTNAGVDRGQLTHQRRVLRKRLETETPKPFAEGELDAAIKLEQKLRDEFTAGMPTQAEMRRKPSGAVDKHMAWEKRNKQKILAWKNQRRRLHASGDAAGAYGEIDLSNIEMYRPQGGANELNLDDSEIPGKTFIMPANIAPQNQMSSEERIEQETGLLSDLQKLADEGDSQAKRLLTSAQNRVDKARAAAEQ